MEKCGVGEILFYKVIKCKNLKETSEGFISQDATEQEVEGSGARCRRQAGADKETEALRRCCWAGPVRPDGRGRRSEDPTFSRTGLETVGHDTRRAPEFRTEDKGIRGEK